MKAFVVLSMVIAATLARPNNYGQRVETQAPVVRSPYQAPAPVVRSTEAPHAYPTPIKSGPAYGGYEAKAQLKVLPTPTQIPIVRHSHDSDHAGKYQLDVETGHGIFHSETGELKDLKTAEGPVGVKTGSYSYTGPDGKVYTVNWTADETGFHATGDHLPTPPPIPEAIQKSLALPRLPEHLLAGPNGEEGVQAAPAAYGSKAAPAPLERAPAPPAAVAPARVSPYQS